MKRSSNRIWWILGGVVVLLMVGLMAAKSAGWIGKPKTTEVEFAKVGRADITERVSASGKVQPEVEVKITPDVPGEIIGLYVAEGDSVTQGKLLLKIRPDNYESLLARARATVNQTKANYEQSRSAVTQADDLQIERRTRRARGGYVANGRDRTAAHRQPQQHGGARERQ